MYTMLLAAAIATPPTAIPAWGWRSCQSYPVYNSCCGCSGSTCYGCSGGTCYGCVGYVSYSPWACAPPATPQPSAGSLEDRIKKLEEAVEKLTKAIEAKTPDDKDKSRINPAPTSAPTAVPEKKGAVINMPARFIVKLPSDAALWVNGMRCPLTEATRSFSTPELQTGMLHSYLFTVKAVRDGKETANEHEVFVKPGQQMVLEFDNQLVFQGSGQPAVRVAGR